VHTCYRTHAPGNFSPESHITCSLFRSDKHRGTVRIAGHSAGRNTKKLLLISTVFRLLDAFYIRK